MVSITSPPTREVIPKSQSFCYDLKKSPFWGLRLGRVSAKLARVGSIARCDFSHASWARRSDRPRAMPPTLRALSP